MSVEEIVRYVRQTPGNTNPSVVGSMVNAEMNSTLEEAKKYTDSKQLARTEKKAYTFDGNVDGKENILGLVKISDDEPDLKQAVSVEITTPETAEGIITLTKDMFSVAVSDGTDGLVKGIQSIILDDLHLVVCIPNEGLYFAYYEDPVGIIYTSKIVFETVHQIDPKFIPGVTLPVINYEDYFSIDFTTAFMQGLSTYQGKAFQLNNVANTEILQNFTPETPAAIVKIPMTMEGQSGTLYPIAEAMCSESIPLQMHFSGSFYTGSIYEYDVWLDFGGNTIFRFVPQEVEYIAET